jgi:hypothetical protein
VHCLKYGMTTNNAGCELVLITGEVVPGRHLDAGGYVWASSPARRAFRA